MAPCSSMLNRPDRRRWNILGMPAAMSPEADTANAALTRLAPALTA